MYLGKPDIHDSICETQINVLVVNTKHIKHIKHVKQRIRNLHT